MKRLPALLLLLLLGIAAHAQVPGLMNYQGQVTDAAGVNLATGSYTMHFRIFDVPTGGTAIWGPQSFDGTGGVGKGAQVPVVNGFFNVIFGPKDTADRNFTDAFNGATRYLEITVGANPAITPRQQILSAPFALKANQVADNAIIGASLADNAVGNAELADNAVNSAEMAANAVTNAKMADNAVNTAEMVDGSVTSAKITDGAITVADLADGSVTSIKIVDGTVGLPDLADGAVTSIKIADGTVGLPDLANGAVTSAKIADATVGVADLANGAVDNSKIADNAVGTSKISDNSVTTAKIADGTLQGSDVNSGFSLLSKGGTVYSLPGLNGSLGLNVMMGQLLGIANANAVTLDLPGSTYNLGIWDGLRVSGDLTVESNIVNKNDYYGKGHIILHAFDGDGVNGTAYIQARDNAASWVDMVLRTDTGFGTIDSVTMLHSGAVYRHGGGSYFDTPSDRQLKRDIHPILGALDTVARLNPVRFHYTEEHLAKSGGNQDYERFGVVAQEYREVFPDYVSQGPDGYLSVRADPLNFVAIAAIKELDARLKAAETRQSEALAAKDREIATLRRELEAFQVGQKSVADRLSALEKALQQPVSVKP